MEFLYDYGLFLAKSITLLVGFLVLLSTLITLKQRQSGGHGGHIEITDMNEYYNDLEESLVEAALNKQQKKERVKKLKKAEKAKKDETTKRLFFFKFDGDIHASEVDKLKEIINTILTLATPEDEVMAAVESEGGLVHAYGLAAAQLERIRAQGIPLTISVDKVAASGGYMMAVIGQKILAAPFAVVGSIGVIAELPNFHRLLKKYDVDYEQHTAGEFKRTLTVLGENTPKARQKFLEELEVTHELFKAHIEKNRPQLELNKVATGEHWYGSDAIKLGLVDEIITSDDYLMKQRELAKILQLEYVERQAFADKLSSIFQRTMKILTRRFV